MKRIIAGIMVMSLLLFAGYPLSNSYAIGSANTIDKKVGANNFDFDLLLYNYDAMKVSESESKATFTFTDEFFNTIEKESEIVAAQDQMDNVDASVQKSKKAEMTFVKNIMKKLSSKVSFKEKNKIVLDTKRKDFGINSQISYLYGNDKFIDVNVATDFTKICLGIPQMSELTFGLDFKSMLSEMVANSSVESVDFKPYIKILLKDDAPKAMKERYKNIIREFINDAKPEKLPAQKVLIGDKTHTLYPYKISMDDEQLFKLYEKVFVTFKDDDQAQDYIFAKIDALFKHFIDSGDYKLTGETKEELLKQYNEFVKTRKAELKKSMDDYVGFEVYKELKKETQDPIMTEQAKLDYMALEGFSTKMTYTVYIDQTGLIRKYEASSGNALVSVNSEVVILALGDEVKETASILPVNVYYINPKEIEKSPKEFFTKIDAVKVIDNISKNIVGGKAVAGMIEDSLAIAKSSEDFEGRNDIIIGLENFVTMAQQQLEMVKMQLQMEMQP